MVPEGSIPTPTQGNYYHNLLACLGYPADAPPVADLLRRYHGLDGTWLVASPIHWQATHNDAMIVACDEALDLSDEESRAWFAVWAECLQLESIQLHYHDAYTWLIQPSEPQPIHALPVHALLQQPMMAHLKALDTTVPDPSIVVPAKAGNHPSSSIDANLSMDPRLRGDDKFKTLFWSRVLTENQMLFSAHPLNQARKNRYSVNGVWIWGGGHLKTPVSRPIVSADDASCKLASLLSTEVKHYVPKQDYPKDTIFLLGEDHSPSKKKSVRYYWNNLAYIHKPSGWITRFWRSLIER